MRSASAVIGMAHTLKKQILSMIYFCYCVKVTLVLSDVYEYRLVQNMMGRYNKHIRPSLNASERLNVTFGLALAQLIDVDEKNQILTTNCWLNQAWIDYNLRWDPAKYGGLKVIILPYDDVWRPDIVLYNNADVSSYHTSVSTNVMVSYDGNITWLSMLIFKSSCSINVKYFPFDEQNCSLKFASWTYDGYQINLVMTTSEGDISNYIKSSEFDLIELISDRNEVFYSCCLEPYPDITYYIRIRRRPLFYVFNMVLPCFLITFVALLGFYIPSDSGEKVTMGITTLLSMTVFMMLVADIMPPTSDDLPLIGLYYGITICIVSFATGFTVFTLNIHHKGMRGRECPAYMKRICFGIIAKVLCIRLELPHRNKDTVSSFYSTDYHRYADRNCSYSGFKGSQKEDTGPHQQSNKRFSEYRTPSTTSHHTYDKVHVAESKLDSEACRQSENGGIQTRFSRIMKQNSGSGSPLADNFERQFMRVLNKVHQTIEKNEVRLLEVDRLESIKQEWQQAALVVDRLLLCIFVAITLTLSISILLQAPTSPNPKHEIVGQSNQNVL